MLNENMDPRDYRTYGISDRAAQDKMNGMMAHHLRWDHGMKLYAIMQRLGLDLNEVKQLLGE